MEIRPARKQDASGIASIHIQSWHETYTGIMPQKVLDELSIEKSERSWTRSLGNNPYGTFVAEEEGGAIRGFVCCGESRDADKKVKGEGEIFAIYLAQSEQGKGIGRLLFETATHYLSEHGYRSVTLWVLEENSKTRGFYEAMGMSFDGSRKIEEQSGQPLNEIRYSAPLAATRLAS